MAIPALAQEKPKDRTLDFSVTLKGMDGKQPLMDTADVKTQKQVTLGDEVAVALIVGLPSDNGESQSHEVARAKLAQKLQGCKSCVVSETEVGLILDRAHQMPQVIAAFIFGQMVKILDPTAWEKADL